MKNLLMGKEANPFTVLLSVVLFLIAVLVAAIAYFWKLPAAYFGSSLLVILGILLPRALMIANQWERMVILRLGKLKAIKGPGLFLIVPFVDSVAATIDQRIQTTGFNAERTLTRDTVPVNVDAIIFWQVHDTERAVLEIANYREAIGQVAQTSLREMIGATELSALLSARKQADEALREEIGSKTAEWGVAAMSVEIRDVAIPLIRRMRSPGMNGRMSAKSVPSPKRREGCRPNGAPGCRGAGNVRITVARG
jgi:regulator of protease activity HflC (stomatin/prohibitin superfamily)